MRHFIAGLITGIVLSLAVLVMSDARYEYRAFSPDYLRTRPGLIAFEVESHGWRPVPGAGDTIVLRRQRIRVPWPYGE
jgi:hypothetical protein